MIVLHRKFRGLRNVPAQSRTLFTRLVLLAGCAAWHSAAYAEDVAGSQIRNSATLHYDIDNSGHSLESNTVALIVAERLDVLLAGPAVSPPALADGSYAVPLVLTNAGNGQEAFALAATLSTATSVVRLIAIDTDGDGRYDAARDPSLADGQTPVLAPGATLHLLALVDPAAAAPPPPVTPAGGTLTVTARAVTGSDRPGTVLAGRGDGGGDAVIGPTGAAARIDVALAAADPAAPTLAKRQSVLAPDGSARAVSGAVITYSLVATFHGPAAGARVDDPLPDNTRFVPGSLTLDGAALSDGADGDAGTVDSAAVHVALGDVAAATGRAIQFSVKIQ